MAVVSCDDPKFGARLIPVDEALQRLSEQVKPVTETEWVSVSDSLLRVLAEPVFSTINVPPLANSSMDGYALRAADLIAEPTKPFRVSQRIPAGSVGESLEVGTVARIFTGAPLPDGADAVVMQEVCTVHEADSEVSITISDTVKVGENVRDAGEDIRENDEILSVGHRLAPQDLGLLASVGITKVKIFKKLRVAVFFTGDELREPGEPLGIGQIYNSNRFTLVAMLQRMGCEVINLGIVTDTLEGTIEALSQAASQADLVMTSGGVSVGEEDHVKAAVESLGQLDLWSISIKPGKPLAFGQINSAGRSVPFLGMPGNPVSVFATTCILGRPFIQAMQGMPFKCIQGFKVPAAFDLHYTVRRQEYLRVRLQYDDIGGLALQSFPNQSSGVLTSASWGDGFAIAREGSAVKKGDLLEYLPFSFFDL